MGLPILAALFVWHVVMQFDLNTALSVAGFIITMGTIVWRSGGQDQKLNQVLSAVTKIETETDSRFAATQAQVSLLQAQLGDVRENLAGNYMKKPEISEIEKRVADKQREIVDNVKEINHKVDKLLQRGLTNV